MRAGGAEGDPEGDGRRTLVNGWESRLWRLEDKLLREGSSFRQFGRPRPLRIRHRRRRILPFIFKNKIGAIQLVLTVKPSSSIFSSEQKNPIFRA